MSLPVSYRNGHLERYVQPLPKNPASILFDRNAPPSASAARDAARTLGSSDARLKPRSQVSVENGYEHPKTWGAGELIEDYFAKVWKYSPVMMFLNILEGKGLLDPRSKIGKVNQLFDRDFDDVKRRTVEAVMTLYRDSLQQLPDGDPVKNAFAGKADIGERRLQLAATYRKVVGGPWDGQVSGLEFYVKPRHNPAPGLKVGGEIDAIEEAERQHAYKRYTFSFSTGALRRLSRDGMNGPDAADSIMVGHPARESLKFLSISGDLAQPGKIPEKVFELKDIDSALANILNAYVETFREPLREASPAEIIVGVLGGMVNNLAPFIGAVEALTEGDLKGFATELGIDLAMMATPGGRQLASLLKRGWKLDDVARTLARGAKEHLPPLVADVIAPMSAQDVAYRSGGTGFGRIAQFGYNRSQDLKAYLNGPAELQATRAANYADRVEHLVRYLNDRPSSPPLSRDGNGNLMPVQLFGHAYNRAAAVDADEGVAPQPMPDRRESPHAPGPERARWSSPGRVSSWQPHQRSGRWERLPSAAGKAH
ncbi:hypothetical protein Ga0061061_10975 [Chelatococcus sambhunathii]|uniref:Uncharacterized protein n=1 Tax=Chelatococcus sambhunathii TaxID=363953 RepID=A0ABM9U7U3_9HYPH|nr:hypothetical protein [Chelatococcus sambhunathii]CUA89648.1 hypothetical protein Ga0061061_10975 [Chelatococcus sambhunathii]